MRERNNAAAEPYPTNATSSGPQRSGSLAHPNGRLSTGRSADALKAAVAGAVSVWVMDRFDWFAFDHEDRRARQRTEAVRPGPGLDPAHALAAKIAGFIGLRLFPAPAHRHPAGLAVHYAVPMALTYFYLLSRRRLPAIRAGGGTLFGAGTFLTLDQVVNPLLGVAADPRRYPWQRNARELISHCIYGFVADTILNRLDSVQGSLRERSKR